METWRFGVGKDLLLVVEQQLDSWPHSSQPSTSSLTPGLPNGAQLRALEGRYRTATLESCSVRLVL